MTSNTSIKAALTVAQGEGGYFLGWLGTPETDVVLEHMTFPGNVVKSMPITTKHPQLASTFSQTTARYALAYPGPAEDQVSVRWLDAQGIWDKTEGQVKNQFSFGEELPLFMGWAQELSVVLGHRGIGAGCGVPAAAMFTDVATVTTAGFALGSCHAKLNGVLRVGSAASGSLAALFVGGDRVQRGLARPLGFQR